MNIRGIYKTSLLDFPGRISTVLFLGGCNLRCRYCYNSDIALDKDELPLYGTEEVIGFLEKRASVVEGVTITGGEPAIADGLFPLIKEIKKLNLDVKIDTNGLRPDIVRGLIDSSLVNYFAVDIKTSPAKYRFLTGSDSDFSKVVETIDHIRNSGIEYEVRSTCVPEFISVEDLKEIGERIGHVSRYYLQQFVSSVELLDPVLENIRVYSIDELRMLQAYAESFADQCGLRGV